MIDDIRFFPAFGVSRSIILEPGMYMIVNGKIERYEEVRENGQLTGYRLVEIENPPAS